jgi:hypothetical protein
MGRGEKQKPAKKREKGKTLQQMYEKIDDAVVSGVQGTG